MNNAIEFSKEMQQKLIDIIGLYPAATKIKTEGMTIGGRYKNGIELDCGTFTATFAQLKKLSELFGTDKIDINNYVFHGGYCETCSYEETRIKIQIYEPTINAPEGFW